MKTTAFLKPLTPESRACLGTPLLKISQFPFRVGRESRKNHKQDYPNSRRRSESVLSNDLYLFEAKEPLNVSREHFQIESRNDEFYLVDRGSACGTLVEGVTIGGDRIGGQSRLENNDVIIVGTSESPHAYKFIVTKS